MLHYSWQLWIGFGFFDIYINREVESVCVGHLGIFSKLRESKLSLLLAVKMAYLKAFFMKINSVNFDFSPQASVEKLNFPKFEIVFRIKKCYSQILHK